MFSIISWFPAGFNWAVAVLRKIITASSGEKTENKTPPLMEFFGPEMLQVCSCAWMCMCDTYIYISTVNVGMFHLPFRKLECFTST